MSVYVVQKFTGGAGVHYGPKQLGEDLISNPLVALQFNRKLSSVCQTGFLEGKGGEKWQNHSLQQASLAGDCPLHRSLGQSLD